MLRSKKVWVALAVLALLVVVVLATRGPQPPTPAAPGTFSFAVLGDAPYYPWTEVQYRLVLRDLNHHDLAWVLHVGDIFWRPCSDEHYRRALERLDGLRHPVIYTPGDNEWTDCWEPGSGSHAPLERLERLREIFFAEPARSLGRRALPVVSQAGREPFGEFVENARWREQGMIVATVHMVGSRNGMDPFPGRSPADDEAMRRRTEAAVAWMREAFAEAAAVDAWAVVLGLHAAPGWAEPADDPYRRAFEPFISALEEEVERFGGPVLLAHGDDHIYTVDHPLVRRTTGRRLANLTRLQVPGSPDVGWVRVEVTPGAGEPWAFEKRVVPRWKYW